MISSAIEDERATWHPVRTDEAEQQTITEKGAAYDFLVANEYPEEDSTAEALSSKPNRIRYLLRCAVVASLLIVAFLFIAIEVAASVAKNAPENLGLESANTNGFANLMAAISWQRSTPYRQVSECPDTGAVCICSDDYVATGTNANRENTFAASPKAVGCQPFVFQVGDVIFFEKPKHQGLPFFQAGLVSMFSQSPIIHAGIVSYVPPEESFDQNADDILVTEALKGSYKKVTQQSLRHVIQRWAFGAFHIRRVASSKFDKFKGHAENITSFLDSVKDQPFDSDMVIPGKRSWGTDGRYIDPYGSVTCAERQRAYDMYIAGGPKKWMCSQLILWTLAFAGRLNLDYTDHNDACQGPGWVLVNLQEWPGELLKEVYLWDAGVTWKVPCSPVGCWVGAPNTSRWVGGMPPIVHPRPVVTTTTSTSTVGETKEVKDDSLPSGWEAASDPASGRVYYYQTADPEGTTTWDKPQSSL
jgi:hypothetical protein